ncbi:MAG: hypothetical protein HYU66_06665 [Armatimonadetes bacterium]|nr:hypothetical protein [Armatimonadota bacterium]
MLGVPAYDDSDVGYHHPNVENLPNALLGIHAALSRSRTLPRNFAGVAVYCEWEVDPQEWECLARESERRPIPSG